MISFLYNIIKGKHIEYRGVSRTRGSMYCYTEITLQYSKSLFFHKWTDVTDSSGNLITFEFASDLDKFIKKQGYQDSYRGLTHS